MLRSLKSSNKVVGHSEMLDTPMLVQHIRKWSFPLWLEIHQIWIVSMPVIMLKRQLR